jgi:hypothetical protein
MNQLAILSPCLTAAASSIYGATCGHVWSEVADWPDKCPNEFGQNCRRSDPCVAGRKAIEPRLR